MQIPIKRPALRYYGGKWKLARWIISFFPEHTCYAEPYSGGASVLLQKNPSPYEYYNDLDSEVVNFFRVLREQESELIRKIDLTPYSREEYELCSEPTDDPVEKARKFYVRSWQAHNLDPKSGWRNVFQGKSLHSVAKDWDNIENLYAIAKRLKIVQIENRPALELIKRVDTKDTLFYIDPPYLPETRSKKHRNKYAFEMTTDEHIELSKTLNSVKGKVIISGYDHPLYDEIYSGWTKKLIGSAKNHGGRSTEILWISPNIDLQLTLLDLI